MTDTTHTGLRARIEGVFKKNTFFMLPETETAKLCEKLRSEVFAVLDTPSAPKETAGEAVDPWLLMDKLRLQHQQEIHNVWMPLVEEYRNQAHSTPTAAPTDNTALVEALGTLLVQANGVEPRDDILRLSVKRICSDALASRPAEATSREPISEEDLVKLLGQLSYNPHIISLVRGIEKYHGIVPKDPK